MSDEVRLAVQRALDKLINRFGSTSDVIGELRAALAALDKEEAKGGETEAAPAVEVSPPAEPEAEPEVVAEPPPKKARKGTGRKK